MKEPAIISMTKALPAVALVLLCLAAVLTAQPEVPVEDSPPEPGAVTLKEVPAMGVTLPAQVLSVHDGDTLKVRVQLDMDVRLLDCWAPEIHGPERLAGFASRDNLTKLAMGRKAILHVPLTSDNIGKATSMSRVLGRLYVNGDDLSYEQVRGGFATKKKPHKVRDE